MCNWTWENAIFRHYGKDKRRSDVVNGLQGSDPSPVEPV